MQNHSGIHLILWLVYRISARSSTPRPAISEIHAELETSPARRGYGELVLGMLRYELGDGARAVPHLRAFVRRNAAIDAAKATTLREELRLARTALAELESD